MNHYQTTFVLNPVLTEEAITETIKGFKDLLTKQNAHINHQSQTLLQDLAYPINKMHAGLYTHIQFQAPGEVIPKLETLYKRNEQVLRFLTTKLDKHALAYKQKQRNNQPKTQKNTHDTTLHTKPEPTTQLDPFQHHHNKKKYCRFKKLGIKYIDYTNVNFLKHFLNDQAKILPRRYTGNSAKYQRKVAYAVKRARILAFLPFITDNFK